MIELFTRLKGQRVSSLEKVRRALHSPTAARLSRPFRPQRGADVIGTQGIGLRPQPRARLSRPVGPASTSATSGGPTERTAIRRTPRRSGGAYDGLSHAYNELPERTMDCLNIRRADGVYGGPS